MKRFELRRHCSLGFVLLWSFLRWTAKRISAGAESTTVAIMAEADMSSSAYSSSSWEPESSESPNASGEFNAFNSSATASPSVAGPQFAEIHAAKKLQALQRGRMSRRLAKEQASTLAPVRTMDVTSSEAARMVNHVPRSGVERKATMLQIQNAQLQIQLREVEAEALQIQNAQLQIQLREAEAEALAATKLQAVHRGRLSRRVTRDQVSQAEALAATKLQAMHRGRLSRRVTRDHVSQAEALAATKLQAVHRGRLSRRVTRQQSEFAPRVDLETEVANLQAENFALQMQLDEVTSSEISAPYSGLEGSDSVVACTSDAPACARQSSQATEQMTSVQNVVMQSQVSQVHQTGSRGCTRSVAGKILATNSRVQRRREKMMLRKLSRAHAEVEDLKRRNNTLQRQLAHRCATSAAVALENESHEMLEQIRALMAENRELVAKNRKLETGRSCQRNASEQWPALLKQADDDMRVTRHNARVMHKRQLEAEEQARQAQQQLRKAEAELRALKAKVKELEHVQATGKPQQKLSGNKADGHQAPEQKADALEKLEALRTAHRNQERSQRMRELKQQRQLQAKEEELSTVQDQLAEAGVAMERKDREIRMQMLELSRVKRSLETLLARSAAAGAPKHTRYRRKGRNITRADEQLPKPLPPRRRGAGRLMAGRNIVSKQSGARTRLHRATLSNSYDNPEGRNQCEDQNHGQNQNQDDCQGQQQQHQRQEEEEQYAVTVPSTVRCSVAPSPLARRLVQAHAGFTEIDSTPVLAERRRIDRERRRKEHKDGIKFSNTPHTLTTGISAPQADCEREPRQPSPMTILLQEPEQKVAALQCHAQDLRQDALNLDLNAGECANNGKDEDGDNEDQDSNSGNQEQCDSEGSDQARTEQQAERILQFEDNDEALGYGSDWSAPSSTDAPSGAVQSANQSQTQAAIRVQAAARGRLSRRDAARKGEEHSISDESHFGSRAVEKRGPVTIVRKSVFAKPVLLAKAS